MSGAYVPYHLRQNKAVDRQLFIDLLSKINRFRPVSDYEYISFGGPYLEDFKLIHTHFGNKRLRSIENDEIAFQRQQFNLPLKCIATEHIDSSVLVDNYETTSDAIIWLDFANPTDLRQQIQQFETLVGKMGQYDIVKITLNANPQALYASGQRDAYGKVESAHIVQQKRLENLTHRLGDYLPDVFSHQMTQTELPKVLLSALQIAANQAMDAKRLENLFFQPLSAYCYADSPHQMLTLCGILLKRGQKTEFLDTTSLKRWKLGITVWGDLHEIKVPALTAREKIFIDQLLPNCSAQQIQKKLGFQFDPKRNKSIEIIASYKKYYRQYPNFQRVIF